MKIKIFDGISEFANFLRDYDLVNLSPTFGNFVEDYDNINVGCGCGKAKRVMKAEESYRAVISILQVDKQILDELKVKAQVSEMHMHLHNNLLYQG